MTRALRRATRVFVWTLGLALGAAAAILLVAWLAVPDVSALATAFPERTSYMVLQAAERGLPDGGPRLAPLPLAEVSPLLGCAIVKAEDRTFFEHQGFIWQRLKEAARATFAGAHAAGGSTITQWAPEGAYYQTMLKRLKAAKELLKDEELRPVVLFSLGINDAIAGTKLEAWKPAVIAHFENLRKELGAETPIVMTRFMPNYAAYNAAIEEICQTVPNTYSVNTLDAPLRDANHWNYAGMKLVTGRMLDVLDEVEKKSKSKKAKRK